MDSSSRLRPTNGSRYSFFSHGGTWAFGSRSPVRHSSSQTCSGPASPFAVTGPRSLNSCRPRPCASRRTRSVHSTWPPRATSARRAASTTGRPLTSPFIQHMSPALSAARMVTGVIACSFSLSISCSIATLASSAAVAEANRAMSPSPRPLTKIDPCAAATARRSCSCRRKWSSASSSPRRVRVTVEPTTSVNSTVAVVSVPGWRVVTTHPGRARAGRPTALPPERPAGRPAASRGSRGERAWCRSATGG